jgi:thiol:disulfide interchange protein DsbD
MPQRKRIRQIIMVFSAILAVSFALAPDLAAQENEQVVEVKSALARDAVRPGETFKAAVILKVQAGYHINDNAPLDEFMIPTSLAIEDNPDFEVVEIYYPTGRRARFSYSEAELVVYDGETALGVLLKAKDGLAPGAKILKAILSYQACDNTSCLPPKELPFEISVLVAKTGGGGDLYPEIFGKLRFKSLQK